MATVRWRGDAPAVAQVQSYAFSGTWESSDIIRVTIGGKTYDFTAGSATTNTVVTNMVSTWNALSSTLYPEFAEITAAASPAGTLRLTADTAGRPFTVTLLPLETGGGGADDQRIEGGTTATTGTSTTANAGPNDWSTAANWSGGAVPADGDDIYIEDSEVDILYGLDQSSIQPTSLNIAQSYTGNIGLPALNEDSATASYYEYRARYLIIEPVTCNIGRGDGAGSQRINLNTNDDQVALNIFNTGPAESGRERTVQWIGTNASNVVNLERGSFGAALEAGEVATIATLRVGYVDSKASDSTYRIGPGVTLGAVVMAGGVGTIGCATTSVAVDDGTLTIEGSGASTAIIVNAGTAFLNSTGTYTTLTVSGTGILDFSQDLRAKTVSNAIERHGNLAKVRDPHKVVASLVIDNNYTDDMSGIEAGTNAKWTRAAVT